MKNYTADFGMQHGVRYFSLMQNTRSIRARCSLFATDIGRIATENALDRIKFFHVEGRMPGADRG